MDWNALVGKPNCDMPVLSLAGCYDKWKWLAGTWQRRPFVISPWKGSVFVGGWLPDHASTPCWVRVRKITKGDNRSFTSVQMFHTHTIYTTSAYISNTTSSTQLHQHITIYRTPSTQHHPHNTIHTTPSTLTLHHQTLAGVALGALPSYLFCLIPADSPFSCVVDCSLFCFVGLFHSWMSEGIVNIWGYPVL